MKGRRRFRLSAARRSARAAADLEWHRLAEALYMDHMLPQVPWYVLDDLKRARGRIPGRGEWNAENAWAVMTAFDQLPKRYRDEINEHGEFASESANDELMRLLAAIG